mgnify:CR=1 FL=1
MPAWKHNLCACCEDVNLCCSACWCQCIATGQLHERAFGWGCLMISGVLWVLFASTVLFDALSGVYHPLMSADNFYIMVVFGSISSICALSSAIFGTIILCQIRRQIRVRDKVEPLCCGDAEDCCVPYWCGCCAIIQMLRQESVDGTNYVLCSPTAV